MDQQVLIATDRAVLNPISGVQQRAWRLSTILEDGDVAYSLNGPSVACNEDRGDSFNCVVAWTDTSISHVIKVLGFRVDSNGYIVPAASGAFTSNARSFDAPEVAWSADGNFAVVYRGVSNDVFGLGPTENNMCSFAGVLNPATGTWGTTAPASCMGVRTTMPPGVGSAQSSSTVKFAYSVSF
jgi:hypothetical protein